MSTKQITIASSFTNAMASESNIKGAEGQEKPEDIMEWVKQVEKYVESPSTSAKKKKKKRGRGPSDTSSPQKDAETSAEGDDFSLSDTLVF